MFFNRSSIRTLALVVCTSFVLSAGAQQKAAVSTRPARLSGVTSRPAFIRSNAARLFRKNGATSQPDDMLATGAPPPFATSRPSMIVGRSRVRASSQPASMAADRLPATRKDGPGWATSRPARSSRFPMRPLPARAASSQPGP